MFFVRRVMATAQIIQSAIHDPSIWEASKPYGASLLHLAVFSGSTAILRLLLNLGQPYLRPSATDCFKRSALCYAACKEEPQMATEIVAAACDPNMQASRLLA